MKQNFGLLGKQLSHSKSEEIHKWIMAFNGWQGNYNCFEIQAERLEAAIQGAKALGLVGLNVTIPYKEMVMPFLDRLSTEALAIGAVNTIHFTSQGTKGYNTDYDGFKMTLEQVNASPKGKPFVVLGAGGAAKAVVKCLMDMGAEAVTLVVRDKAKAKRHFPDVNCMAFEELKSLENTYCLINATPIGMYPHGDIMPIDAGVISRFEKVIDLIYNPHETMLLKTGAAYGADTINGLYMLVGQAVRAQEIWQKAKADPETLSWVFKKMQKKD